MTIDQLLAELEAKLAARRERKMGDYKLVPVEPTFQLGDRVRKTKGSQWKGRVVGTYSTNLTPEGYAVESDTEKGSVQIYPAAALELVGEDDAPDVAGLVDVLESALGSFDDWCEGQDPSDIADAIDALPWVMQARAALAAHRKQESSHDNR